MTDRTMYLGDGLYAHCDAYGTITLRAPRGDGEHYVVLEPAVLDAFEQWLRQLRESATRAPQSDLGECKACATRARAGLDGQCPACASERSWQQSLGTTGDED